MRKRKRFVVATALAVGCVALAAPAAGQANEVTHWNRIAMSTLVAFPGPAGGAPRVGQRPLKNPRANGRRGPKRQPPRRASAQPRVNVPVNVSRKLSSPVGKTQNSPWPRRPA